MKVIINLLTMATICSFLMAAQGNAQEASEREQLALRRAELRTKIEMLSREQDFLLFQKQMYGSDSKYLLLDLAAGKGKMMYRDRVLKDFSFSIAHPHPRRPAPGMLALTSKSKGNRSLRFGKKLVVEVKQNKQDESVSRSPAKGPLRLELSKDDMASLFYNFDPGSPAYIVR